MRLVDKVALITGGGSGIGRATAVLFASEGARVIVSDLSQVKADDTVKQIDSNGNKAISINGDISESSEAQRIIESSIQHFKKLDILINSAGVSSRNALPSEASPEQIWDRVIAVNLKGTYLPTWFAVPEMKRTGGGSIVNLSSIIGLVAYNAERGLPFDPYPASKGAIIQFTRNLAVGCARDNIRVNCICPGYVWSPLTEPLTKERDSLEDLEKRHPMGRLAYPEDIAHAALYLASDEASYVTGTTLAVDGGYTAQ